MKLFYKFIIFIIIIIVIPLTFLGFKVLEINETNIRTSIMELHIVTARSVSKIIDGYVQTLKEKILFAINTYKISSERLLVGEGFLRALLASSEDFLYISIVDRNGKELKKAWNPLIEKVSKLVDISRDKDFRLVSQTGVARISAVYYENDSPRINIVYPLPDRNILFIKTTLERVWDELENAKLGNTGFVFLIDSNGQRIDNPQEESLDVRRNPLVRRGLVTKMSFSQGFTDERGDNWIGAFAPVGSLGWGVVIQQSREEAYVSVERMRGNAIKWILISILVAVLGGFLMVRTLSKPIMRIVNAAKEVSRGNFDVNVKVTSKDEISTLAKTFNTMTESLKEYNELQVAKMMVEQTKTEAVIFSIGDGIIMTDFESRILLMNRQACKMLNIEQRDYTNKRLVDFIKDERIIKLFKEIPKRRGESLVTEFDLSQDGGMSFLKATTNLVQTKSGMRLGKVTVLHDITLEKEIDGMKEDFLHSVTHDLRTPVSSIKGFVELLREGKAGGVSAEQTEILEVMDRSANKLLGMVSDILDLAKIETGKMKLNIESFNFAELIKAVVGELRVQADSEEITLFALAPKDINIEGDRGLLERALNNLVSNALKFTPQGGKIDVVLRDMPESIEVSVIDTGEGIPKNYLDRVFDKFQQVEGKKRRRGTGLGLTICKYVVEVHGGRIWAESELGQGSKFNFELPKKSNADKKDA